MIELLKIYLMVISITFGAGSLMMEDKNAKWLFIAVFGPMLAYLILT